MGTLPSRERATALARAEAGVAEAVEKYRLLEALSGGQPGRSVERRDAMRRVADRFPGALREWDEAPPEAIVRRRAEAERTLERLRQGGDEGLRALAAPEQAWLRYSIDVHARLRQALRVKRWLGRRALTAALADDARRALDVEPAELEAGATRGGRVSEAVYRQVAAAHGVTVDELKAALFVCDQPSTGEG